MMFAILEMTTGNSGYDADSGDSVAPQASAKLSAYFAHGYLHGQLLESAQYTSDCVGELRTFRFDASDGPVQVCQHPIDLRDSSCDGGFVVLYHYTNALAFENIANSAQSAAELFASLVEKRAQFGEGVYASQYEPSVWQLRLRILLNNYSNAGLFRDAPSHCRFLIPFTGFE
ncbi:kidins220 [Symbiodinium sp. CCMP2592]|nr:kidins220 [Symbiodinium sp. CCMP2592]